MTMKKLERIKVPSIQAHFQMSFSEQQLPYPLAVLVGTTLCLVGAIEGYICGSQNYQDQCKSKYTLAIFFSSQEIERLAT